MPIESSVEHQLQCTSIFNQANPYFQIKEKSAESIKNDKDTIDTLLGEYGLGELSIPRTNEPVSADKLERELKKALQLANQPIDAHKMRADSLTLTLENLPYDQVPHSIISDQSIINTL